ncbi:fatty acid-binding protein, adipocyte [Folsomia candida]|uniref:Fatty acid-binding protein, muscle n=1 Tax=Folsomia candida TaxID=158441 RepID=A0A226DQ55_FOLCA|nr:fatty acid-binding protein, adipocyte [Folsomia candida]OXA46797.1 Fatty acid-binding protein, adipocyte [Folsomia candida]
MSFTGKFELVSSDNFDEYLKACGVGMAKRALAATAKPTIEISEAGGLFTMKTSSTFKNTEIKFKLGEEFDEETADGRQAKSTMTADGNKLIHSQKIGDDSSVTVREFSGDSLKASFTAKGVTGTRVYKKV